MAALQNPTAKKTGGKTQATKSLIIQEYKRRLKDNIRSLNDNFNNIIKETKINLDDSAHKNTSGKMAEYTVIRNEMSVRAALIARACDELMKLTNDLKEFLILHDFTFLTQAIKTAEEECDRKMSIQVAKHNAMRCDISNLCADIDKDIQDNFCYRH